jgi:hypothetical protein
VAYACNPSYSRGRDLEQDPILKKTHHKKRAGEVAQGVGPEFKLQYHREKKKRKLYS